MNMIPTVGRVIYIRVQGINNEESQQPFAGLITRVNEDGTINAAGWNAAGCPIVANNSPLKLRYDEQIEFGTYCHWMDYQVAAAATEARNDEELKEMKAPAPEGPSESRKK